MKSQFVNKKIGFFGASITDNGYYLYHIRSHIANSKDKCMVFNHGVGGTRAEMGVYTIKDEIEPCKPDYMFIEFGVNDLGIWLYDSFLIQNEDLELSKQKRNQVYYQNITGIVDYLIEQGIKPILMTPFAVNELLVETDDIETLVDNKEKGEKITPAFYKRSTFTKINQALKGYADFLTELGASKNIPVVDVFSATYKAMREQEGLFSKDGIHYTEDGASVISCAILEFLGYDQPYIFEKTTTNDEYWELEKLERSTQFFPWNFCHPIFGNFTEKDIEEKATQTLNSEKSSELNKRRASGYLNYYKNRHQLRKQLIEKQKSWFEIK